MLTEQKDGKPNMAARETQSNTEGSPGNKQQEMNLMINKKQVLHLP